MLAAGSLLVPNAAVGSLQTAARGLSDPTLAMLSAVIVAVALLGVREGRRLRDVMPWCERAVSDVAMVLLVVGGAGAFKQVLTDAGASQAVAELILHVPAPPLVLAWTMAALVRVCMGVLILDVWV